MAILNKKKKWSLFTVTLLLICIALFSNVILGSACAKKLIDKRHTNQNRKGRRLHEIAVIDTNEEFLPESSLYGIVPVPQD